MTLFLNSIFPSLISILSEEISIFSDISILISAALSIPNIEITKPTRNIFCIKF